MVLFLYNGSILDAEGVAGHIKWKLGDKSSAAVSQSEDRKLHVINLNEQPPTSC